MARKQSAPSEIFVTLLASYAHGRLRINEAEVATHRTMLAAAEFVVLSSQDHDWKASPYAAVLEQVEAIAVRYADAYRYVSHVSLLVYSTTLLDTFLSDLTRFLLLLHPASLGKSHSIGLEALLSAASLPELITSTVGKKAREISHHSFLERLGYLRDRFGLVLDLDEQALEQLKHYSSIRNTAVHDQGFLDIALRGKKRLRLARRACPFHPTLVTLDDLRAASSAYDLTVLALARAVLRQVLKVKPNERATVLLEMLEQSADRAKSPLKLSDPEDA